MEGIEKAVPSVSLTKKLISYFEDVARLDCGDQIKNDIEQVLKRTKGSLVPFELVRRVFQVLKDAAGEDIYLHEMISGSDLILPGVKFPPRDPELEARVTKLKFKEAEREYQRMTQNVDSSKKQHIQFNEDVKSLNRQIIAVFNFLVTVCGAFAFGYKGMEVVMGNNKFLPQVITGLIFGTVVFFADLYFLLKYNPQ